MIRRTASLDGDAWQIRSHPGTAAALAAAGRRDGRAADGDEAIHDVHTTADAAAGWVPARVPGSVLDDLIRAGEVRDVRHERDSRLAEWVPERAWTYRRAFDVPSSRDDGRVWLRFGGIDHAGHVFVDRRLVASHEGMFVPLEVELVGDAARPGRHELAVVVEPAPHSEPQVGRTSLVRIHKARMTYGWDFSPRMIHQGLWQSVELETAGPARIRDIWTRPRLADDLASGTVTVRVTVDRAAADLSPIRVTAGITPSEGGTDARSGAEVVLVGDETVADIEIAVGRPALWWPNGLGDATLHELTVRLFAGDDLLDERTRTVGFRRIERLPNEGGPADARPWTFVVNGRPIELLGWNWAPLDALYGVPQPDRLEHLLGLVAASHANLVRVWGGGLIETDAFYDACDRLGILVWQEFSQSSSGIDDEPARDDAFVDLMRREAEAVVPLRRNHPSLAIWCGGNELQDAAGPLEDDRSPVLAALHDVVARLDPDRIWLPTSPSGPRFGNRLADIDGATDELHDVHGPWEHQGLDRHNDLWDRGTSLMNGEFGVEGMTNRRVQERLIDPERRWPADGSNSVYRHLGDWWNNAPVVSAAFGGRLTDLESMRRASQRLQADGLRYAIEANRRRWPRNTGSIPWQLHESFPNAWSTAAIAYGGDPKPAYHAAARAFAESLVCARFASWALHGADAWAVTPFAWGGDGPATMTVRLVSSDGVVLAEEVRDVELRGRLPVTPGEVRLAIGDSVTTPVLFLDLELRGAARATNRYLLARDADLGGVLDLASAALAIDVDRAAAEWCIRLSHTDGPAAAAIRIEDERAADAPGWATPDDDGFDLLPGEERLVRVRWEGVAEVDRRLRVDAWNVAPVVLA